MSPLDDPPQKHGRADNCDLTIDYREAEPRLGKHRIAARHFLLLRIDQDLRGCRVEAGLVEQVRRANDENDRRNRGNEFPMPPGEAHPFAQVERLVRCAPARLVRVVRHRTWPDCCERALALSSSSRLRQYRKRHATAIQVKLWANLSMPCRQFGRSVRGYCPFNRTGPLHRRECRARHPRFPPLIVLFQDLLAEGLKWRQEETWFGDAGGPGLRA